MSKLPEKIEDWTAPWEQEGKTFDAAEAKRWAFNLQKDREREETAHAATKDQLTAVTGERDTLKVENDALKADTKVSDLQRENAELKAAAEKANQNARKTMLDAVKAEFGLTDRQAAKLDGDDLEALRLDAKETFGEPSPGGKGDGESEKEREEEPKPGVQPQRTGLRNAGDPSQDERGKLPSRDEVLAGIPD